MPVRTTPRLGRRRRSAVALLTTGLVSIVGTTAGWAGAPTSPSFGPAIEGYAANDPQNSCDPTEKPGTQSLRSMITAANAGTGDSGISRACSADGTSEHKEGRAWDWQVSAFSQDANVQDVFRWLFATDAHGNLNANFRRLGIMYIIYNKQIISSSRINEGWRPYPCSGVTSCHQDHVHFSQSRVGGAKQTSYWTAGVPTTAPKRATTGDWGGDARADVGVFRPSSGQWLVPGAVSSVYGGAGDVPVPADYNGDGNTDVGIWRPSTGKWSVPNYIDKVYGVKGDIPVPADWTGDGRADLGVFRPSTGEWFILGRTTARWGGPGDIPVPGDWNGDGKADLAVWRPSTGQWLVPGYLDAVWGTGADVPVPADYDGDGRMDRAVWRPSTGQWYVPGLISSVYGGGADVPVPADWNGDGKTDVAVFRASTGEWLVPGLAAKSWGGPGDVPVSTLVLNRTTLQQLGLR